MALGRGDPRIEAAEPLAVRAARASLWSMAGQIAQQLIGVLSFLFLARWLSPADYGLAGMAAAVSSVLAIAGDAGVVAGLVRQPEIDDASEATAFWIAVGGGIALAVITATAAPLLALYFREDRITLLSAAMGLNFVLATPGRVSTAKLVKKLQFSQLARLGFAASLCGLVVAVVVARRGGGAWAIYAQAATTFAVQAALLVASAPYEIRPRKFSHKKAAELATFGSEMTGFLLALIAARAGDTVLGGRLVGPQPLGLLSMAAKLSTVPIQRLMSALGSVFMPAHLEVAEESRGTVFARALTLTAVVTFPISLGGFAVAPEIVAFLPARWSELARPLRILALGTLVEPVVWYSFAALSAQGRTKALLRLGLVLVPVGWVGSLLGALAGSAAWLALAWVVWSGLYGLGMAALVWKPLALKGSLASRMALPLASGLAMVGVVRGVLAFTGTAGAKLGLPVGVAVGVLVYALALLTVMRQELAQLLDLTRRAIQARHIERKYPVP